MGILFDIFPVLLFFLVFKLHADPMQGVLAATGTAIAATLVQVGIQWWRQGQVKRMHWVTLGLVVVLGGATLVFRDPLFIKWKPTAVYWMFALAFLGSQFIGHAPLLQRAMGHAMSLPAPLWRRANLAWAGFFAVMGVVNLYVAFRFSLDTWVNFKTYGALGATLVFMVLSAMWLSRYAQEPTESKPE